MRLFGETSTSNSKTDKTPSKEKMGSSSSKSSHNSGTAPSFSAPTAIDYRSKPLIEEIGTANNGGIEVSKSILDFNLGERPCPLKVVVQDQFTLVNLNKSKMKFNFEPSLPKEFQLSFSPSSGSVDKGKSKIIKIKLIVNQKINANHKVVLRVEGGVSHFLTVKIRCETGVFGVDPATLEMVEDVGCRVPSILVAMKRSLIEYGGLEQEGIFRLAGEQTEIKRIKESMNKNEFNSSNDINTVASLIKIWYRELPTPILNSIPTEKIFHCNDVDECVDAVNKLPEMQKNLLDWLMNLLLHVASHSNVNKMTLQNLAIVVAPNLYDVSSSNPMEGLVLSQKCVQFLHNTRTTPS
ncbi:RhoGAP domain-containing protein [Heterostelium album PN500]|uniref:RhoGAP domain-containing protein n=1 Tax=Heterostelium pallidum (strain ATCC 26659 / Pp 5 / PN500) TaxID=670386 RepID=D3BF69_HETP5|nr:RhoGAP domain-containing protein [Heterostelium album PN500]EFA79783.1 RhoGAP domain-containing protein [Heterostelium album PN500]|eukprot:XP_020431904.1 RhoGAP domain-containing protein [Heterostelium album PN500]